MQRHSWLARCLLWLLLVFGLALLLRLPLAALGTGDVPWPRGIHDDRLYGEYGTVRVPDEPWVLIIGGSTIHHGVDAARLGPVRKQSYARGFPSDVALALSWTLRHGLPRDQWPRRIVWGLAVASLVDRRGEAAHPCATPMARARPDRRLLDFAPDGLCGDVAQRARLSERLKLAYGRLDPWYARSATTRDLAISALRRLWSGGPPEPRPEEVLYKGQNQAILERNLAAWQALGVFAPEAIAPRHASAMAWVTRLCQEAGIPLTLVSMPETSIVRERYSPESRAAFNALLQAQTPDVLDLWSSLPDHLFYDQAHLNAGGREQLTALFAEHLGLPLRQ